MEAAWSSLQEYFALNESIERVFRDSRGRFISGPARIVTAELMAGLHTPEVETKVAAVLDMKGSWKEHPDLVYSVARKAAEAWTTVEQADKLRYVHSRVKGTVARVGNAKGEGTAVVGRGRQGSSACSGDLKPCGSCWKEGHRRADCTTKRKSGLIG